MAKKATRLAVKLHSTASAHIYTTEKNRRNDPQRLEIRKYDPIAGRHALYQEVR
jgi:large subunit ribosomal protein L33